MASLKLMALDEEDLKVISSFCQDSVLKTGDMTYDAARNRFVMTFNRFAWEVTGSGSEEDQRRKSVLHFERVKGVKLSGIDLKEKDMVLSLLAVLFEPGDSPAGHIELVFAGDGAVRLAVECIEAQLSDMPAAWKAVARPKHA